MEWFVRWRTRLVAGRRVERRQGAGSRRVSKAIVCLALLGALATATWAFATNYVYDANGRLVVVTNDVGESARYVYDAMGNLTAIERLGAGDLAIFAFNPTRGTPGVQVRVQGHGFSTNPSENALSFNGAQAAVSTATANELVAIVPAAATTGPLSVTVGGNTASSATDFIVDEAFNSPVVHEVTPIIGAIGTEITVSGASLNPLPGQTNVRLNARLAHPSVATNSAIAFPVPIAATTGKVRVSTPFGSAESLQDVVVVPNGIDPADVVQVKRVSLGGPAETFDSFTTGKYVAVVFDGIEGDYLTAIFHGLGGSGTYRLYGIDNVGIANGAVSGAAPNVAFPKLPATGIYLLLVQPPAGSAPWSVEIRRDTSIEIDGDPVSLSTIAAGRPLRITFYAVAGQRLGLGIASLNIANNAHLKIGVYRPNGAAAISPSVLCYNIRFNEYPLGCGLNLEAVVTGTYSIVFTPSGSFNANFEATLTSDHEGILTRGAEYELELSRRGENARLKFAGVENQTLALLIAKNQSLLPTYKGLAYYTVFAPNGVLLASKVAYSATTINLPDIPLTGEYEVFVTSENGAELRTQLMLIEGIREEIDIDGPSRLLEAQLPDQNIYLTFSGVQGQRLGLGVTGPNGMHALVYAPNGETVAAKEYSCGPCGLNLAIPTTGTYMIVLDPIYDNQAISAEITLSADIAVSLERDASSDVSIQRFGQNARLSFVASAGEGLSLEAVKVTAYPLSNASVYFTIYKPGGEYLTSTYKTDMSWIKTVALNLPNLPETGEYTIFVDPPSGAMINAEVKISSDPMEQLEVDGASKIIATTTAGGHVFLTFEATAGQRLGLGTSDTTFSGGSYGHFNIVGPSGVPFHQWDFSTISRGFNFLPVPETGTYTVAIAPPEGGHTMISRWTLSTDLAGTLQKDVPATISLRQGQNARYVYSAAAGESLKLTVSNQATTPAGRWVTYTVYRPNGTSMRTQSIMHSGVVDIGNITSAGLYTVYLEPQDGSEVDVTLALGDR